MMLILDVFVTTCNACVPSACYDMYVEICAQCGHNIYIWNVYIFISERSCACRGALPTVHVQRTTVQYGTMQCSIAHTTTKQYSAKQCSAVRRYTARCYTVQ